MSALNKGKFITFEGIDGCGKSTQVKMLVEKLKKLDMEVITIREPGGTRISESIRDILLYRDTHELGERTEALLMTASRAQLTKEVILPALNRGTWVIADRYADSTLAYQGGGRKVKIEWLEKLNEFATYDTIPYLTFFIDILPDEGVRRQKSKQDRIEQAGIDFQSRTRDLYLKLAEKYSDRIIVINGQEDMDTIHKNIWKEFENRMLEK
ncbi:MAG: dTMP kinase [Candidatus Marinimicrobia bacterium]|nr:dTMP kinase [Candidatus Neomarinimicrobiota bacterium]